MNRNEILNLVDRSLDRSLPTEERIRAVNSICSIWHERCFRALVQIYCDPLERDEDLNVAVVEGLKYFLSHTRVLLDLNKTIWSRETECNRQKRQTKSKTYQITIKEVE